MTDLRIIPADPRDQVRDRYRTFASEDRLPSPLEYEPRPARKTIAGQIGRAIVAFLPVLACAALFWMGAR